MKITKLSPESSAIIMELVAIHEELSKQDQDSQRCDRRITQENTSDSSAPNPQKPTDSED
ncbi:hypothetical protein NIES2135_34230 [Leptolyngbya boryana NIES-2135]|jgi:hypothetical protein|uniref:Uncharacterized protein n=1 Tax=Leptolyngbya boryana NIES-2135 TaxID=1973484 RepID=A0A1Z4JIM2_LEPBY|nr:hypothetical protein LBWT_31770 [Leptolyngbya boryana IAM M-101]BAS63570.1 hypothetical protein LBDG_31770 [Leptolyngbya boryana dg5]BAY56589.1 hypothetical protein NIES2135_34230 [Leptolyngbya boryana NIES-2135]